MPAATAEVKQPELKKMRFYLSEADGVRCIALLLVWFHHYPVGPPGVFAFFHVNGWIGVNLFLVLSSFLITSLLMLEAEANGTISLPRFYIRRFLRIWPLLGWALLLNYLLLPAINYFPGGFRNPNFIHDVKYHAVPNLLLLGNWSAAVFSYLHYGFCNHLWTINLEEQFYLLWPLLLSFLVNKPCRFVSCCLTMVGISYLARYYYTSVGFEHPALWVSTITRLDPLAFGGILAVCYRPIKKWLDQNRRFVPALISSIFFVGSVALTSILLRNWAWSGSAWWKLGAADFTVTVAIGCALLNPLLSLLLRLRVIAWLGKISYGLYVYHKFIIRGGLDESVRSFFLRHFSNQITAGWLWSGAMVVSLVALIVVSAASYYLFERRFLTLKERFETVRSRPA